MKHGVAPPSPNPAKTRMAINMGTELANTVSIVKPPISSTATISSVLRPKRSASGPKDAAPTVAPTSADEKIGPKWASLTPNSSAMNGAATPIDWVSMPSSALTRAQQIIVTI